MDLLKGSTCCALFSASSVDSTGAQLCNARVLSDLASGS